ncbi:cytochrome P450 [Trichodelitschia bisporula]|uniref:Cytochrome P450 n=1 Tax=Trichodelitschia bisporula TaxID=703511 RepID=A0A6G1HL42_9PEZI|nr:cytochrome P450 [Trichodelitschia bisporula]
MAPAVLSPAPPSAPHPISADSKATQCPFVTEKTESGGPVLDPNWTVDTSAAVLSDDPKQIYAEYEYMREHCPVAWTSAHGGYWILTKYEDIKACAGDGVTFISSVCAIVPSDPRGIRRPPLKFDGAAHTPYRKALDRTLNPRRLARLEPALRGHAKRELAPLLEAGQGDICQRFGARFSAAVESEWLGLDEEAGRLLAETVGPFVQSWRGGEWEFVLRASQAFYKVAEGVMEDRRTNPRDPEEDPASSLLLERDSEGKELDPYHLIGAIRQALIVAMVAPSILMGAIVEHLAADKALQNQLRSDPSLIPAAIEEFVRLYTPYRGFARTATHEVTISGTVVPPETPITMTYAAANRDGRQFPDPETFMLGRENITSHLGFGRGRHRCAGVNLARMMLRDWSIVEEGREFAKLPEVGLIGCKVRFVV